MTTAVVSSPAPQGHCSRCGKIWTLNTGQGVCQWCGKPASCQTTTTKPRHIKSRSNGRRKQANGNGNGYDQLDGEWLPYYKVARTYEHRIPLQDREDFRHDVMIELDRAHKRDNKPLPLLRAYRIASLTVALYYRNLNRYATRVCIVNGYPIEPHCKACKSHTDSPRCAWLAIRPVERLDGEVVDPEGYRVKLLDTVADDHAIDLDAWLDAKTFRLGCPLRLIEVAERRKNGIPLNNADKLYLGKWRKREQKRLIN